MAGAIEFESTLTDRYQTTVPDPVRRALGLGKRDKINYRIQPDGTVVLARAEPGEPDDPALTRFLRFLANDIDSRPQAVSVLGREWLDGLRSLVEGAEIDLSAPLPPGDD